MLKITLFGAFTGIVGTGAGAIIAMMLNLNKKSILSFVMDFSAGLMISIVCFDLLPQALNKSKPQVVFFGIFIGVLFSMIVQSSIKFSSNPRLARYKGVLGTGVITAIGIMAHNFPEGLAIGTGFEVSATLGVSLCIVIIIHDIPEGTALAAPLLKGGVSKSKAVLYAMLAGFPTCVGAFIGAIIGEVSPDLISLSLAFASGAMLYISFGDLIPESKSIYKGRLTSIADIFGVLVGMFMSIII